MTSNPIDPFASPSHQPYGAPVPGREETEELPLVPPQIPPVGANPAAPQPFPSPVSPGPAPFPSPVSPGPAPFSSPSAGPPPMTRPVPPVPGNQGGKPRKSGKVVLIAVAVVVLLAGAGAAVYFTMGSDKAALADPQSSAPADDEKSGGKDSSGEEKPSEESAKPSEEAKSTQDAELASRPTKFGAWWAGEGKYAAKWDQPDSDGGQEITSYLVGDCDGNELATVEATTFHVTVEIDELKCMSVQAVTAAGPGEVASFEIAPK